MSESAVRQKVFEKLSAMVDIGVVHKYERWGADWGRFIALFQDPATKRILGCEITRPSVASIRLSNIENQDTHTYMVKMYMGVEDAAESELLFEEKIERVRDEFKLDITLGGTCSETSAVSKTAGDTRMFGNVLCHYAELTFTATEY